MLRLGWLSTGRDEAARALLKTVRDAIGRGEVKAEIAFVFSNREPGEAGETDLFFAQVKGYRIPLLTLSSSTSGISIPSRRLEYDKKVMGKLGRFKPDLLVLAGYMLILGEEMCRRYPAINLHPAAPGGPKGIWQEVIWQLIRERARASGVMMHLVTPELDRGPAVTFCTYPLRGEMLDPLWNEVEKLPWDEVRARGESLPLFRAIREEGLKREFPLIVATLQAFGDGEVRIEGEKVLDRLGRPIAGHDLTAEIEKAVGAKPG